MPDLTWYLIRHGETEWNAVSRMQGQLDSALTPRGRAQVAATADLLARVGVDVLFASPLGRVRATVDILNERLALPVRFDDRLKEWSAGDWSGELYAEIGGKWPVEWAAWQADRVTHASPGGENFLNLLTRARSFLADAAANLHSLQSVGIVAHGFINRALAAVLLDQPPAAMLNISQGNDSLIRIVTHGGRATAEHFANGAGPLPGLPLAAGKTALA